MMTLFYMHVLVFYLPFVLFCFVLAKMTYEQMVDFKSFTSFHKHTSDQMDSRL